MHWTSLIKVLRWIEIYNSLSGISSLTQCFICGENYLELEINYVFDQMSVLWWWRWHSLVWKQMKLFREVTRFWNGSDVLGLLFSKLREKNFCVKKCSFCRFSDFLKEVHNGLVSIERLTLGTIAGVSLEFAEPQKYCFKIFRPCAIMYHVLTNKSKNFNL